MADIFDRLEQLIASRQSADAETSYVARLFAAGRPAIARKLGEEAVELVVAALVDDDAALIGEAADLLFHLIVLLADRGLSLDAVRAELARREGYSGIEEKAARTR